MSIAPQAYPATAFAATTAETVEILICHCYGVTRGEMVRIIESTAAETVEDVLAGSCAGSGCTACHCRIRQLIRDQDSKT